MYADRNINESRVGYLVITTFEERNATKPLGNRLILASTLPRSIITVMCTVLFWENTLFNNRKGVYWPTVDFHSTTYCARIVLSIKTLDLENDKTAGTLPSFIC